MYDDLELLKNVLEAGNLIQSHKKLYWKIWKLIDEEEECK